MTAIDKAIFDTNLNICKNIENSNILERGFISQNILSQLRNFIEYLAMKLCSTDSNIDPNDYDSRCNMLRKLKSRGDLRLLYKFHELLQISASHYTLDENTSERLMLKYYELLLKLRHFLLDKYKISVLENIEKFPINLDEDLKEFYQKISERIDNYSLNREQLVCKERLYIQKIKPFFINDKIYYEITFTLATDNVSKFDRVIAFTSLEIIDNYAVYFNIHKDKISILGHEMEINIIDSWKPAIRPCELEHFVFIFNGNTKIKSNPRVYEELMKFIRDTKMNLLELIDSSDELYSDVKNKIIKVANNSFLFDIFDSCRDIILNKKPGTNILRYFLFNMNNRILKKQINYSDKCDKLSGLFLDYGAIPFDIMPFATSLKGHNPKISDLLECIPIDGREHEFLARYLKTNTEQNACVFTKIQDVPQFNDIDQLIDVYNQSLYYKHRSNRSIVNFSNYIYIKEYAEDCAYIINRFIEISKNGLKNYSLSVINWLNKNPNIIDDPKKQEAIKQMFEYSRVSFIYGSAGSYNQKLWIGKNSLR